MTDWALKWLKSVSEKGNKNMKNPFVKDCLSEQRLNILKNVLILYWINPKLPKTPRAFDSKSQSAP